MFTHGNDVAFENIGSFWCISDPKLFEYDPEQFEYENMFNLKHAKLLRTLKLWV